MNPKDDKAAADDASKGLPRRFESTLPTAKKGDGAAPNSPSEGDLDLDLGDIQSRLPYGSEDIADK